MLQFWVKIKTNRLNNKKWSKKKFLSRKKILKKRARKRNFCTLKTNSDFRKLGANFDYGLKRYWFSAISDFIIVVQVHKNVWSVQQAQCEKWTEEKSVIKSTAAIRSMRDDDSKISKMENAIIPKIAPITCMRSQSKVEHDFNELIQFSSKRFTTQSHLIFCTAKFFICAAFF